VSLSHVANTLVVEVHANSSGSDRTTIYIIAMAAAQCRRRDRTEEGTAPWDKEPMAVIIV